MNAPRQSSSNHWLVSDPDASGEGLHLLCFPPAGAGALLFRPWFQYATAKVQISAIQLPGREHRLKEPCFTELPRLVTRLADDLLPVLQNRPFAFFGHSMGGLICFELARELRRRGNSLPEYLLVSGRRAPQIPIKNPLYPEPDSMLVEALRQYGGTPEAVLQNSDLMELFLPIFRSDLMVNEKYDYNDEPPLDCPLAAFGGTKDIIVNREQLQSWNEHTSQEFELQMFAGNHMFFKDKPQILLEPILAKLNAIA